MDRRYEDGTRGGVNVNANAERASEANVKAGVKAINEERRTGKVYEKRIKVQHVFSIFVESRMPVVDRKYMSKERPIASTTTGYDSANRNRY